jgi:bifunctional NMN adenylyltransferase/nudix hydrolase
MVSIQKADLSVVIGRFQIHRLHEAHEALIRHAVQQSNRLLILLGCAPTITKRNPLSFPARSRMLYTYIQQTFKGGGLLPAQMNIIPILDHPSNEVWAHQVDGIVRAVSGGGSVRFTWGAESAHDIYVQHGSYLDHDLMPEMPQRATAVRAGIKVELGSQAEAFRAGAIWQQERLFVNPWPTVDMVITHTASGPREVLLGQKDSDGDKWRFPGGFVDPTDHCLEAAARREIREECGDIEVDPRYIGSLKINDWRLRGCKESIITSVFHCPIMWNSSSQVKAGDDLKRVAWFKLNRADRYIHDVHKPILDLALEKVR